jgi:hypothetical protein
MRPRGPISTATRVQMHDLGSAGVSPCAGRTSAAKCQRAGDCVAMSGSEDLLVESVEPMVALTQMCRSKLRSRPPRSDDLRCPVLGDQGLWRRIVTGVGGASGPGRGTGHSHVVVSSGSIVRCTAERRPPGWVARPRVFKICVRWERVATRVLVKAMAIGMEGEAPKWSASAGRPSRAD